jgi:hypothetical protein
LADGSWEIVKDISLDNFSREMIAVTEKELLERSASLPPKP